MATVTNTIKLPDGSTPTHAAVVIELVASTTTKAAGWVTATDVTILSKVRPTVTAGAWTASLTPNADITPSGTVYKITETADRTQYVHYIEVDSDGGSVFDLLVDPPASLASAASELYADAAVAAHTGDASSAHAASAISATAAGLLPSGTVASQLAALDARAVRYSAAAPLIAAIRGGLRNVNVLVLGDSTGDETTEWVYLLAQWLGTQYTTHTIKYSKYDAGGNSWPALSTVVSSAGTYNINIYNGSQGGYQTATIMGGGRWNVMTNPTGLSDIDLVIVSLGHNESQVREFFDLTYTAFMEQVTAALPRAGVMCIAQNASLADSFQSMRRDVIAGLCNKRGFTFVDVWAAFAAVGNGASYYADNVHPSADGEALWASEVQKYFASNAVPVAQTPSSLIVGPRNLLTATQAALTVTLGSPNTLDGWTNNSSANVAAGRDATTYETGSYSLKLESLSSTAQYFFTDLAEWQRLKGMPVTFAVRAYKPSGVGLSFAACYLVINDGVGSTGTVYGTTADENGWRWFMVRRRISTSATRVRLLMYPDSPGGVGKYVLVDRASLCIGDTLTDGVPAP